MKFSVDDYFLPYLEGKREVEVHLAEPTTISQVLVNVHIQVWEEPRVKLNGQVCEDMNTQVTDKDEVYVYK